MTTLFKNKKGSSVIETIMLFPIFLYLILFSTFKILSYFAFSHAYEEATVYSRSVISCETPEKMFNQLAMIVYDPSNGDRLTVSNTSITNIKVTSLKTGASYEIDFHRYGEGADTFASYCHTKDGIKCFDYDNWNNNIKDELETNWETGSLIEIELSRDLTTDILKNVMTVAVYDYGESKMKYFTVGVDTDIKVVASNVLSY